MVNLTLYADEGWISPWVLHAMVALEEKKLPYVVETVPLPIPDDLRRELRSLALIGKVPILVHGDAWISESLAISEYLAESFPFPGHPRLFPADYLDRARARQVMLFLRTDLVPLREERPTTSVFGAPVSIPLSDAARAAADELIRISEQLIAPGQTAMFDDWCIADADLGLALARLHRNRDPLPDHLATYAEAQWNRPSTQAFLRRTRG